MTGLPGATHCNFSTGKSLGATSQWTMYSIRTAVVLSLEDPQRHGRRPIKGGASEVHAVTSDGTPGPLLDRAMIPARWSSMAVRRVAYPLCTGRPQQHPPSPQERLPCRQLWCLPANRAIVYLPNLRGCDHRSDGALQQKGRNYLY